MINERDVPSLLHSFNPLYSNASDALNQIPISNENIDYVQICPVATTALKEVFFFISHPVDSIFSDSALKHPRIVSDQLFGVIRDNKNPDFNSNFGKI